MIKYYILCSLVSAAVLSACGPTLTVTSDYDKSVQFGNYKTFVVVMDTAHNGVSAFNRDRIMNSVRTEMMKKGYTENTTSPDMIVDIATILKDRVAVSSNTNYYGYGGYYRPYGWGGGMGASGHTTYDVQHYKDGSLIIGVADANKKSLIWEGIGNREIDGPISNPDQVIASAVTKIMAGFPPGGTPKSK